MRSVMAARAQGRKPAAAWRQQQQAPMQRQVDLTRQLQRRQMASRAARRPTSSQHPQQMPPVNQSRLMAVLDRPQMALQNCTRINATAAAASVAAAAVSSGQVLMRFGIQTRQPRQSRQKRLVRENLKRRTASPQRRDCCVTVRAATTWKRKQQRRWFFKPQTSKCAGAKTTEPCHVKYQAQPQLFSAVC